MVSQPSDIFCLVADLKESARHGDWRNALEAATALRDCAAPANAVETGQYLDRLREALVIAKASRTHLAATLVRLNAAARFGRTRAGIAPPRQEFGEAPEN